MIYLNLTNGIEYLKDWELHEEKQSVNLLVV